MSSKYSIWPVFVIPYNLPPWMCMKSDNMMLSLLIPGPKAPGNDIDVFLQPLIDEFKQLWEVGVKTYDAYTKKTFDMRAILLWTIQDFPAYANLSGWSTKGHLACPNCHKGTSSKRLANGKKWCYMGHRRFLEPDHRWRVTRSSFDGKQERNPPPTPLSGHDILEQLSGCANVVFGKLDNGKRKRGTNYLVPQWKKIPIFLQLPYWRHLKIHHNLDVMHIEKNVCDNILGTLFDISGKNKDTLKARFDLEKLNMHPKLRPILVGAKYQIPRAPFLLTPAERKRVAFLLSNLALPDGYSSNISRCVSLEDGKIWGMKSHDCHVFMQDLLVPTLSGVVDDKVMEPLRELSLYFKQLCSKTLKVDVLTQMEKSIAITLYKLERIFVPAFFDVMVHLVLHLATEAKLAGPVHYRWSYRVEREIRTQKSSIRNKAHPEGSIAEARIESECLEFCSRYLTMSETKFNRVERNEYVKSASPFLLSVFLVAGKPLGKGKLKALSFDDRRKAHNYILQNCEEAQTFMSEYENDTESRGVEFFKWLENKATKLWDEGRGKVADELLCVARGPLRNAFTYEGYVVNGFRFHTKRRQRKRKTQNSGVVVKGSVGSDEKDFYGVLEEVIVLEFDSLKNRTSPRVVLFKCKWYDIFDNRRGIKRDKKPSTVDDDDVDHALSLQCSNLFKGWRYRIREEYFAGRSKEEALSSVPVDIEPEKWIWLVNFWSSTKEMEKSEKARANRLSQKTKSANGSRFTARIVYDMVNAPPPVETEEPTEGTEGSTETTNEEQDPVYLRVYEKTKRHKGEWDPEAQAIYEANYKALKDLHSKQIEAHGEDNLTIKEAYLQVMKPKSGYVSGLGYGARPPKTGRSGVDSIEMRAEINKLKERETSLCDEVKDLKTQLARVEANSIERERKFREEMMRYLNINKE